MVVVLLNQADDDARLETGRDIAHRLLAAGFQRVVISGAPAPQAKASVREVVLEPEASKSSKSTMRTAAVVLAAGRSTRMGSLKLALRLGEKSLLRRVAETALASPVDEVVVVLGHGAAELRCELPKDTRLHTVYNPDFAQGQSLSLRAGIGALDAQADAAVVLLGDQPLVRPEAVAALVEGFRLTGAALVRARYRGEPSHPVLFGRPLFAELAEVSGDQGGREVLARHNTQALWVNLDLDLPLDIDTEADYRGMAEKFPQRS
jgi:molybdenum cofactor cytidylyltransferase